MWLGNRYWIRYGIDKIIHLFTLPHDWSLKRKWEYWGGGGRVNWWVRNNITFDQILCIDKNIKYFDFVTEVRPITRSFDKDQPPNLEVSMTIYEETLIAGGEKFEKMFINMTNKAREALMVKYNLKQFIIPAHQYYCRPHINELRL